MYKSFFIIIQPKYLKNLQMKQTNNNFNNIFHIA